MKLRQLEYFVTLAEELHFRRAAERAHIAQPAFSEQIRRLECELGARLFDRTSHYVRLTQAGRLFLDEVRPALAQVEHATTVAVLAGRGVLGNLTIGLGAAALNELTPVILREFADRRPEISVELREYGFVDPSAGLGAGEVDAAMFRLPVPAQHELEVVPLLDEPWVAVMPADHRLAGAVTLKWEDLVREPLVNGPHRVARGVDRAAAPVAETLEIWLALVEAGRGLGLAPASAQRLHGRRGLRYVAVTDVPLTTLAIGHRREVTAPAVRELVGLARDLAQDRRCLRRGDRGFVSHETDFDLVGVGAKGEDSHFNALD
jgi:DNA-binding transcriptional LysR family regulator